jgi:integrase
VDILPKSGSLFQSFPKRFGRLKTAQAYTSLHSFHSIRKTAATELERANVSPLVIPAILGHDVGHISFDIYSAGASMEQKKEAIEKLHFDFTL